MESSCCLNEIKNKKHIYGENSDEMDIDDDFNNNKQIKENTTLFFND